MVGAQICCCAAACLSLPSPHCAAPPLPLCAEEYHRECVRLVTRLHQWDVLRANKAPFAFGLETRVPFLDKQFLQVGGSGGICVCGWKWSRVVLDTSAAEDMGRHAQCHRVLAIPPPPPPQVAMNIDPRDKMPNLSEKPDGVHAKLEKYILRKVGLPDWLLCAAEEMRHLHARLASSACLQQWPQRRPRCCPIFTAHAGCAPTHPPLPNLCPQAFDDPEQPYLPDEVLFRQKEQFSDGVGYDWVDGLKEYANKVRGEDGCSRGEDGVQRWCRCAALAITRLDSGASLFMYSAANNHSPAAVPHPTTLHRAPSLPQVVTDDMWETRFERFPVHPPRTREYYLLRSIFESHFPHPDAIKTVPQVGGRGA